AVRERILRVERERPVERAVGLGVVARVAGLARALLVAEAEEDPGVLVPRIRSERGLEARDERGCARGETGAGLEVHDRLPTAEGARRGARLAEGSAEERR